MKRLVLSSIIALMLCSSLPLFSSQTMLDRLHPALGMRDLEDLERVDDAVLAFVYQSETPERKENRAQFLRDFNNPELCALFDQRLAELPMGTLDDLLKRMTKQYMRLSGLSFVPKDDALLMLKYAQHVAEVKIKKEVNDAHNAMQAQVQTHLQNQIMRQDATRRAAQKCFGIALGLIIGDFIWYKIRDYHKTKRKKLLKPHVQAVVIAALHHESLQPKTP